MYKFNPFTNKLDFYEATSGFVPYTGATSNVDLGSFAITGAGLTLNSPSPSTIVQKIKAFTGQSENLFEFRNSANELKTFFDYDGVANFEPTVAQATPITTTNYVLNGNPFVTGLTSWTSTGWTYSSSNGGQALHTSGNTNPLSQTVDLTGSPSEFYKLSYTASTAGTANTFTTQIDGVTVSTSATSGNKTIYFITASSSCFLSFIPGSTRTKGIYNVKIEALTPSTPMWIGKDGSSTTLEARATTDNSIVFGINSFQYGVSGSTDNIVLGNNSLTNTTSGYSNLAIGNNIMTNSNSSQNVALGNDTLSVLTTGTQNFALGLNTLSALTTGSQNTATGIASGLSLTTGINNSFYGYNAGRIITTGSSNLCIGTNSGNSLTTGSFNVMLGENSGIAGGNTSYGIVIGFQTSTPNEDFGLVLGKFMTGRFGRLTEGSSIGMGIDSNLYSKLHLKPIQYEITGVSTAANLPSTDITGSGTLFTTELAVGDEVLVYNSYEAVTYNTTIATITNDTTMTLTDLVGDGGGSPFIVNIYRIGDIIRGYDKSDVNVFKVDKDGRTSLASGAVSNLGIKFSNDTNTGFFGTGSDVLAMVTGGTERMRINAVGQMENGLGTAALPTYTFTGDLNTGMWSPAADTLAWSTGGSERMRILNTGNVQMTNQVQGPVATESAPTYSFTGDLNTGVFSGGADNVQLTTGGSARLGVSTTAILFTLPFRSTVLGSAAAPIFSFSGDTDTGMFSPSANQLSFSCAGTTILNITASLFNVSANIIGVQGSQTVAGYAFFSDTNTGMFSPLADTVAFTTNGSEKLRISSTGDVSIGTTTASARLHLISTTEQLRVGYDASNYFNATVGSTGTTTFNAVGSGSSFVFSDAVNITSSLQCDSIVNDTGLASGTYTPTLTGVANVTSTTARQATYMRVGNTVTVAGQLDVTPTSNFTRTRVGISLPVASNFTTAYQAGGTTHRTPNTTAGHGGAIYADATNDRVEMDYHETLGAVDTFSYIFTYEVI